MSERKVPKIRFPGFTEEWEELPMSEVFEERMEKNHPEMPVLSVMQGQGTVLRDNSDRNIQYDKSNLKGYKLIREGDYIIHLRSFEGGLEYSNHDGISSPAYRILKPVKIVPSAYRGYFRSKDFIKNKLSVAVVGIRDGKNIDMPSFWDITIPVPEIKEQENISQFLLEIDDQISTQQKELDKWKELKKGMLQKMFPKEGESVSEIRFPGFTDPWEQRKLSSIYGNIRNAFVGTATPYYVPDGHFYLESNNVKDGQINRNTEVFINDEFYYRQKDKWLHTNDMVMVQSGHVGHAAVIPENLDKTAAHALIMFTDQIEETEPYFLNYQYQTATSIKKIADITKGNTIKHILSSDMQKFIVDMPSLEEQRDIASFFRRLDTLITLHQRECDKWQTLKKALLQQMFV